jgi:hypothetical protein
MGVAQFFEGLRADVFAVDAQVEGGEADCAAREWGQFGFFWLDLA